MRASCSSELHRTGATKDVGEGEDEGKSDGDVVSDVGICTA